MTMHYVDVGNLLHWFMWRAHPSGIQRYHTEILRCWEADNTPIQPCAFDATAGTFIALDRARLLRWIDERPQAEPPRGHETVHIHRHGRSFRVAREDVTGAIVHFTRAAVDVVARRLWRRYDLTSLLRELRTTTSAITWNPGDSLINLTHGLPIGTSHIAHMDVLRSQHDIVIQQMIYDVIPGDEPELVEAGETAVFKVWFTEVAARAHRLFTISAYSRQRIQSYARTLNLTVPEARIVPLGSQPPRVATRTAWRPANGGDFVLCVGSIEPRKNQEYLVHLWSRLVRERGAERTPYLVLAGKLGPGSAGLAARIGHQGGPSGRIIIESQLDDQQLANAYASCLFTVFPSLSEGWGIPVCESLHFGKYCLASSAASIPEAGGSAVDYLDPLDGLGWLQALNRAIDDPPYRASRVAAARHTSWETAASELASMITTD